MSDKHSLSNMQRYSSSAKTTVSNETYFVSDYHGSRAFQIFQDMRTKEEHCDVLVSGGGRRFPAHRVVLAGTCPLFREKLAAKQEERELKGAWYELEIPEQFDKSVGSNVLDFLYTGKLVLSVSQMMDLLQLLCYLKVKRLLQINF